MEEARVTVRMPKELHEALKAVAESENRSVSNQIITALRHYPPIKALLTARPR